MLSHDLHGKKLWDGIESWEGRFRNERFFAISEYSWFPRNKPFEPYEHAFALDIYSKYFLTLSFVITNRLSLKCHT